MRKWAGNVQVQEVMEFLGQLHAGYYYAEGERRKVHIKRVRYEEGKHDNMSLVVELKDGTELVFDVVSPTPPTRKGHKLRPRV